MNRFWVALIAFAIPTGLSAQKTFAPWACSFDTAAYRDSLTITLSLLAFHDRDTLPDAELSRALGTMVRERFHAPESIGSLLFPNVLPRKPTPHDVIVKGPGGLLFGTLVLNIGYNGRVGGGHWTEPTLDSATDNEILRALGEAMDSIQGADLAAILSGHGSSGVLVQVTSRDAAPATPLIRLHASAIRADTNARILSAQQPTYPPAMRSKHIRAAVLLDFVIGEDGHVLPATVRTGLVSHPEFAESAIAAVLGETFEPARAGGCPIAFRAQQFIRYTIDQ